MKVQIHLKPEKDRKPRPPFDTQLGFGKYFSDHMLFMEYRNGVWAEPHIEPYQNLSLSPAAMVFHYGQEIFEGMKAYRSGEDLFLFRPRENMRRMNKSAERLAMPNFDENIVLNAIETLVRLEKQWIPQQRGYALYIRPTMIATEAILGVKPSSEYLLYVIVGPVGAYYEKGFNPIDIYVSEKYSRAVRGGTGATKAGGNYAASLLAQREGMDHKCSQVLWLDAIEHKYIEEVGSMNIFVRCGNTLLTPELSGSILPGVTRNSVMQIAKHWGFDVEERAITLEEVLQGIQSGHVDEVFGTGTAAIISPVERLMHRETNYTIKDVKTDKLANRLFNYLLDLQTGVVEDTFGFVHKLEP